VRSIGRIASTHEIELERSRPAKSERLTILELTITGYRNAVDGSSVSAAQIAQPETVGSLLDNGVVARYSVYFDSDGIVKGAAYRCSSRESHFLVRLPWRFNNELRVGHTSLR
jgi:hypothetical protein